MVLQSAGPLSFSQIQTEFGGTNPISLSEYYTNAAGGYTTGVSGLPATGAIIVASTFLGKAKTLTSVTSIFTSLTPTTWTAPTGITAIRLLVVGGGGGGGISYNRTAGGGGGGGVVYYSSYSVTPGQTYNIVLGSGGGSQTNGGNSSFGSVTASGGGAGGGSSAASSGGCGGGGTHGGAGASGTQGGTGGSWGYDSGSASGTFSGCGGGGGGGGTAGVGNSTQGGSGGNGFLTDISGSSVYYAGGGGGSVQALGGQTVYGGSGGAGGGGGGAVSAPNGSAGGSASYFGGGGGGAAGYLTYNSGGSGYQGIVIVKTIIGLSINLTNINSYHQGSSSTYYTSYISSYYNYTYDMSSGTTTYRNVSIPSGNYAIADGTNDMFDTGNAITFMPNGNTTTAIVYGTVSNDSTNNTGYWVANISYWPHISATWTGVTSRALTICVTGNSGSDTSGTVSNQNTTYSTGSGRSGVIYFSTNYNATDPAIGEVWFTITNSSWNSSVSLTTDGRRTTDNEPTYTDTYSQYMTFTGTNFILCKALLSKYPTANLSTTEVANFVSNWVQNMPSNCFV